MGDTPTIISGEALDKSNEAADKLGTTIHDKIGGAVKILEEYKKAGEEAAKTTSVFNDISTLTAKSMEIFGVDLNNTTDFFKKLTDMTEQQANAMSLLSVAVLGTSKVFDSMADNRGLNSFSSQIKAIVKDADSMSEPFKALASALGFGNVNVGNLSRIKKDVLEWINNMGGGADKAMAFSRSIYDLAARTGQLGNLYHQTGDDLGNLLNVSEQYFHKLEDIGSATNTTSEEVGRYFGMMKNMPQLLDETSSSGTGATDKITQFQKIIQLAHGTGQDFKDVLEQTTKAYETYGVTGDTALNFTARASQLNKEFGINLGDTQGFINKMSESFQMLGDNTNSATSIFEQFFGAMKAGGLGIKPAIDTIGHMGEALANLSIAQKAFISSRSGGPGGLLGSVEIEKDLAAGKSAEVLDKIRKSFMQSVGGRIVTRDDVHSEQDAAQFTSQRMKLQSGAFGNIAKDDNQAAAILKAFASPGAIDKRSADEVLNQSIKEGANYEKMTATNLVEINKKMDSLKGGGGFAAARIAQSIAQSDAIKNSVNASNAENQKNSSQSVNKNNNSSAYTKADLTGLANAIPKEFAALAKESIKAFGDHLKTPANSEEQMNKRREQLAQDKANLNAINTDLEKKKSSMAPAQYQNLKKQTDMMREEIEKANVADGNGLPTRPSSIRRDALSAAQSQKTGRAPQGQEHKGQQTGPETVDLTVNVYLPNGKKEMTQQQINISGNAHSMHHTVGN